jgi:hypothetical protein
MTFRNVFGAKFCAHLAALLTISHARAYKSKQQGSGTVGVPLDGVLARGLDVHLAALLTNFLAAPWHGKRVLGIRTEALRTEQDLQRLPRARVSLR